MDLLASVFKVGRIHHGPVGFDLGILLRTVMAMEFREV